jgi:hypothetical protein
VAIDLSASSCTGAKAATLRITVTSPLGMGTAVGSIPVYY